MSMEALIINSVVEALREAGIPAQTAYPGEAMPDISAVQAAVSLEKLDYTARSATVLVTVMAPVSAGGKACEDGAIRVGGALETMGGICVQEGCRFNGYADAYSIRVLGTFYGAAVMADWESASDFTVKIGETMMTHAVAFRAQQVVDQVTGVPADDAVWTIRLEEHFARGERPQPPPTEPFVVTVKRSGSTEIYNECCWTTVQLENTPTGLRQIRQGVAKIRAFAVVG